MIELKLDQKGVQELVSNLEAVIRDKDKDLELALKELAETRVVRDNALRLLAHMLRKQYAP